MTIFEKKKYLILNTCSYFLGDIYLNVSQPNKNLAWYYHKFTHFFALIYYTDSIYKVYKDKLQNCSCNQKFAYVVMSDLKENWTFSIDFSKNHKYKVNNNPSSGRIVVSYSRTVGQSGMKRLTAAFRTIAKAPTNCGIKNLFICMINYNIVCLENKNHSCTYFILCVSYTAGNFLASWAYVTFQRRTMYR